MDTTADTNQQKTTTDWSVPNTDTSVPTPPPPPPPPPLAPSSQTTAADFFTKPAPTPPTPMEPPVVAPPPVVPSSVVPPPPPPPAEPVIENNFSTPPPKKSVTKVLLAGIVVLLLAIAIPVTYLVVNQNTENRTKAASAINCTVTCNDDRTFADACPGDTGSGGTFGSCEQWANEACGTSGVRTFGGGIGTCGGPAATPNSCVPNKVAGDACDPSCGNDACDGSGPLACQQCGANTSAPGEYRCFDGTTLPGVIAGCGAGGVASPPPGGQSPAPSSSSTTGCTITKNGNCLEVSGANCIVRKIEYTDSQCPTRPGIEQVISAAGNYGPGSYCTTPSAGLCHQIDFLNAAGTSADHFVCSCNTSSVPPNASSSPSPSASPLAQCTNVKLYQVTGDTSLPASWSEIAVDARSNLKAGDVIYISTMGSASGTAQVTRARIRVNSTSWTANNETVLKKPKAVSTEVADEYYIIYTIPADTVNFTIGAEVYSPTFDDNGNPSDGHLGWR